MRRIRPLASNAMSGHRWRAHEISDLEKDWATKKRWVCSICSAQIYNRPDRVPNAQKKITVVISSNEVEMYSCDEYLVWSTHKE